MDRTSSFPKQDFEGMVCEIWSGLDICLYHAAYVRTYADSTAMRLAGSRLRETSFGHNRWNALIPATGLIVSFIWWNLVDSYKDLNTAKFEVIHELEEQLPVALFRHEWFVCGHNRKKKDKPVEDKYVPLTHVERWVPVAFAVLYIGLGAYALLVPSGGKGGTQQTQPVPQHQVSVQHPATESH